MTLNFQVLGALVYAMEIRIISLQDYMEDTSKFITITTINL